MSVFSERTEYLLDFFCQNLEKSFLDGHRAGKRSRGLVILRRKLGVRTLQFWSSDIIESRESMPPDTHISPQGRDAHMAARAPRAPNLFSSRCGSVHEPRHAPYTSMYNIFVGLSGRCMKNNYWIFFTTKQLDWEALNWKMGMLINCFA
jgi:hypothetical protein